MSENNLSKKRVIVVDDDEDIVNVFSDLLEVIGAEVVAKGYGGLDAIRLFEEFKPDVVFLDISMPEYDGFYALEKIKDIDNESTVILITGDLTKDTEIRSQELGASAIIYKPFQINGLIDVINRINKDSFIIQSY